MKVTKKSILFSSFVVLLSLSACQRDLSPYAYTDRNVGSVTTVYNGTVVAKQNVLLRSGDRFFDNAEGIAAGAAIGGLSGSLIGKGKGQVAGALAGTVLGGVIGGKIQEESSKQMGVKYTIELSDGRTISIIQGQYPVINVGQSVSVEVASSGRSRVFPR